MSDVLATVTTVVSLLLAAIALIATMRDRAPDRVQFVGTVAVNAVAVLLLAAAVVTWIGGSGPREVATFIGYGLTLALLPAGAWIVGKMEPTRFGSLIVGVAALIMPVLVLRLGQVWGV
ncbi:hypothetical protein [Catellatospora sp. TT07R-123]|uniref:hypothetical protein n=1 Tax=Catellatospora sp. TT07R-123 TaxID=2733863 RepID=UPI001BB2F2A4|nr:hypothetical protein [Catellatospora sp. TT07R-123]